MESNFSTSSLVHIGVELVVIGGLSFWIHKKTSDLQEQVTRLTEKVGKYDELLRRQADVIAQHENGLRHLLSIISATQKPEFIKDNLGSSTQLLPKKLKRKQPNITETITQLGVVKEEEEDVDALLTEELAELADAQCDIEGLGCGKKN